MPSLVHAVGTVQCATSHRVVPEIRSSKLEARSSKLDSRFPVPDLTNPLIEPSTDPLVHDDAALERLRRFGGEKLLAGMIALFLEDAPARLAAARAAIAAGDPAGARAALHALKSSAAQLGALRLSARCASGEALARNGAVGGLAELVAFADADLATAAAWLSAPRPAITLRRT